MIFITMSSAKCAGQSEHFQELRVSDRVFMTAGLYRIKRTRYHRNRARTFARAGDR